MSTDAVLPTHVSQDAYVALVETIAGALIYEGNPLITDALDACNLQPTSRAAILAASATAAVLVAHEVGQEIGDDEISEQREDELNQIIELIRQAQREGRLPQFPVEIILEEAKR